METVVERLEGDRMRLTVEIPAHDVRHAVSHAASDLAASVKVPGFRQGKVPMPVLVSRLGKNRIYAEAVESHIGSWFWDAATRSRLQPTEPPRYSYDLPSSDEEDWSFTAEFPVQAPPELVDWTTLEVPKAEVDVPEEVVRGYLEELQRTVAEVAPVEGRLAQDGDVVVVDLVSGEQAQRDVVVELGAETLLEEIENGIRELSVGESRQVVYEVADGTALELTATVKELREKILPPLDDELAKAASEFDTLDELRADVEGAIRRQLEEAVEARFRSAAVDELVKASDVRLSALVVEVRTRELLASFLGSLRSRGVDPSAYFELAGLTPQALEQRLRAEATLSVARELVLEAVADKLALEVDDDEIRSELAETGLGDDEIDGFLAGDAEGARHNLRLKKAVDRIAAEVQPISMAQAQERAEAEAAREKIWTPGQESPASEKKLWTPGSKELAT